MAARHVGRRIGTVSSQHRAAERRRRSTPAAPHRVQRGKRETLTPGERRHLIQLVACGSIFVLLVAVKLVSGNVISPYPLKTFLISQRKGKGLSGRRKGAFLMDKHPRCGTVLQLADKEQTADCRRNVDRP